MSSAVYLDHAATTPPDARVVAEMARVLAAGGANPAAIHAAGRAAAAHIEAARAEVAALVDAAAANVVFTSGATEANNLAILGHAQGWAAAHGRAGHLISLATEHKSVLAPLRLLRAQGWRVTLLQPDRDGLLAPEKLAAVFEPDTALVSLLWVNNETGVVQNIAALAAVCHAHLVPLHVDAAQAAGKVPVTATGCDYLVLTGHKLGGPQGIGALVVAPERRAHLAPQIVGGGQERGLRSGTPAEHQIAGFALACRLAESELDARARHMSALRDRLWAGLQDLPGALLNGHPTQRVCGILNVTFDGIEGESLYAGLGDELAVSPGSACDSATGEPSFVLRAMGRDREQAQSSLRFSLAPGSTQHEVDRATAAVRREHARLWQLAPDSPPPTADWEAAGAHVVSGEAGGRRLGAWVRWHWRIADDRVAEARFQAYGCPAVLGAVQHLADRLQHLPRGAPLPGSPAEWLEAVNSPVEKLGRMLIIEDAAQQRSLPGGPEIPESRMSIQLTSSAADRIRNSIAQRGHGLGLRLGVRKTGCSGYAYVVNFADEQASNELVFEDRGVKVFIDPASLELIDGTTVDFVKQGLNEAFKFQNPNVKGECGCGESFNV